MNLEWIVQEEVPELAPERVRTIVERLRGFVANAVQTERARCVTLCRDRAALWERTSMSRSENPSAVAEARSRSNEARYLADLIEFDER
jgi:hypothetical protein